MTYNGFFVRDNLGQMPNSTPTGWSASPDTILYGLTPAPNPSEFTTQDSYGTDYGSNAYINAPNYVYLRALNTSPVDENSSYTGIVYFYYTQSDLFMWPAKWRSDNVTVLGQPTNQQAIVATSANQICVTPNPFIWTPPTLVPPGVHHCVVSYMENPPLQAPPWTPTDGIRNFTSCEDLAEFLWTHPNMGWRNTTPVSGLGPSWSQTVSVSGPPAGGQFQIGIQCNNMPNSNDDSNCKTTVSFTIAGGPNGDDPPQFVMKPQVPWGADAFYVTTVTWPANCATTMVIEYTSNGDAPPPPGAGLSAVVILPPSSRLHDRAMAHARSRPGGVRHAHVFDAAGNNVGISQTSDLIGAMHYVF